MHAQGQAGHTTINSTFTLFGISHLLTLAVVVSLALATRPLAQAARQAEKEDVIAWLLAAILVGYQIVQTGVLVGIAERPWSQSLPLHLCHMDMFVCAAMLALRSYRIFEVAYFWGIGGSAAAMLTPDLPFAFPDPLYVIFFASHTVTIISVLYAISAYGFRPRLRSVGIAVVVTFAYMLIVMAVNTLLDTNYMYLRTKPEGASIMDYMGPWPWYVVGVVGLGSVVCLVCYAPFAFRRNRR